MLADVAPGSPADRAGLSVGDLVLTLDGKPIENGRQLHVNLYRRAVGEQVRLEVLRGDQPTTITVSMAERADPLSAAALVIDPRENIVSRLGILAATLDPKLADALPLRAKAGVVVASASAGALDTDNGGLQPGDIIHAVNGQWIIDLPALRQAIDAAKPGAPISAPCTWEELESGAILPQTLKLRDMKARLESVGDLWAGIYEQGQSLLAAVEKIAP